LSYSRCGKHVRLNTAILVDDSRSRLPTGR
jgi:hypothetical protein